MNNLKIGWIYGVGSGSRKYLCWYRVTLSISRVGRDCKNLTDIRVNHNKHYITDHEKERVNNKRDNFLCIKDVYKF